MDDSIRIYHPILNLSFKLCSGTMEHSLYHLKQGTLVQSIHYLKKGIMVNGNVDILSDTLSFKPIHHGQ